MSFLDSYKLDEAVNREPTPVIAQLKITPGVYSDGLISIFDRHLSELALSDWQWLLGSDVTALAATAFGDIFFWSNKQGAVYFLETQFGRSTHVDTDVSYLFDDFLAKAGVSEGVLNADLLYAVRLRLGRLAYGQCYIAEPWIMLGGTGHAQTYACGDLATYLSLTGQAVHRMLEEERQRS